MGTGSHSGLVLVHGAFVDGSLAGGLRPPGAGRLSRGRRPEPDPVIGGRRGLDAASCRRARGPVVLVGHSYGGAVITEAGTHPKVTALAYIAAFAPDNGESVRTLNGDPNAKGSPIVPAPGGFLFLDRSGFHASFAGDLPASDAAFLADAQVPLGVDAMDQPSATPPGAPSPARS